MKEESLSRLDLLDIKIDVDPNYNAPLCRFPLRLFFSFFLISLTWELCGQMSRCASMRVLWMKVNLKDIIIFAYISYSDLRFRYLAAFTKRREDLSTGWSIQSRDIQQLTCILWTKDVCTMKVRPVLCLLISMCNFFYTNDFLFAIHSNRVKSIKALSRLDGAPCMRVFLKLCNLLNLVEKLCLNCDGRWKYAFVISLFL